MSLGCKMWYKTLLSGDFQCVPLKTYRFKRLFSYTFHEFFSKVRNAASALFVTTKCTSTDRPLFNLVGITWINLEKFVPAASTQEHNFKEK